MTVGDIMLPEGDSELDGMSAIITTARWRKREGGG